MVVSCQTGHHSDLERTLFYEQNVHHNVRVI